MRHASVAQHGQLRRARREGAAENQWDEPKLPEAQAVVTTGTISAVVLLLATLALRAGIFARELGALIGQATVAVIRSVFTALGGFLAR